MPRRDLYELGVTYCDTPELAASELEVTRRRVDGLLDELGDVLAVDRRVALDNAIVDLESMIVAVATARLMATIIALNGAGVGVYVAAGRVTA